MSVVNKITPKLLRAINKHGVDVEVYRSLSNEYGEPMQDAELVVKLKGLYSESNHSIKQINVDAGKIKKDRVYKLIALIDDNANKLLESDVLIMKNTKFELININNASMLDCYYDLTLKRC